MNAPTRDELAFNIGRFRATTNQLIEMLEWYADGPKHTGDCEFTDKVDEGCYLCARAARERYPLYVALRDRAKQLVQESWPNEDEANGKERT